MYLHICEYTLLERENHPWTILVLDFPVAVCIVVIFLFGDRLQRMVVHSEQLDRDIDRRTRCPKKGKELVLALLTTKTPKTFGT